MFFIYVLFSAHIHSLHSFLQVLLLFCAAVKWDRAELSTGETKQIPPADRKTRKQLLGKQIFPDPPRPPPKKNKRKKLAAVTQDICEAVPEQRTGELEVTLWLWAVSED